MVTPNVMGSNVKYMDPQVVYEFVVERGGILDSAALCKWLSANKADCNASISRFTQAFVFHRKLIKRSKDKLVNEIYYRLNDKPLPNDHNDFEHRRIVNKTMPRKVKPENKQADPNAPRLSVGVTITVDGRVASITMGEARRLYQELKEIFGGDD